MSFTVIIPARYASSRLPRKPLADIAGKKPNKRVQIVSLLQPITKRSNKWQKHLVQKSV